MSAAAISAELEIWRDIAVLMRRQRALIMSRDHQALSELNGLLQEKLLAAVGYRRSGQSAATAPSDETERALARMQREVCVEARINTDLLSDALAYVEFSLQLLYPHACSPVYNEDGQINNRHTSATVNRSA